MKVIKRSTVSAWNDFSENTSQSFPGIAVTPSGQIIVSWRNAPQKESLSGQNVFYSISDDGGFFAFAQSFIFKIIVIEAVKKEVKQNTYPAPNTKRKRLLKKRKKLGVRIRCMRML